MDVEPEALHITPARLSALSDGVIAIAATLLILDLKAPAAGQPVWRTLGHQWPALDTYAVTFLVIGIAWIHHHNLFHQVRQVDRTLLLLNIGMLATISFLPLPTATLGSHLRGIGATSAAVLYALSMTASALWFTLFWNHLCRHPELLHPGAREQARAARRKSFSGPQVTRWPHCWPW
ncbi:TMEM175 family protein [Streptacidiphilus monticola]